MKAVSAGIEKTDGTYVGIGSSGGTIQFKSTPKSQPTQQIKTTPIVDTDDNFVDDVVEIRRGKAIVENNSNFPGVVPSQDNTPNVGGIKFGGDNSTIGGNAFDDVYRDNNNNRFPAKDFMLP